MLELCPNCEKPVVLRSQGCANHRSSLDPKTQRAIEREPRPRNYLPKSESAHELTLDELCDVIAMVHPTNARDIRDPMNILHENVRARRHFVHAAVRHLHYRYKDLTAYLSQSNASMVNALSVIEELLWNDPLMKKQDAALQTQIALAIKNKTPDAS